MKISILDTAQDAGAAAADAAAGIVRDAIRARGRAVFVAATGNSQLDFLEHLTDAPGIDWGRTTMFHLDEYIGLPADHPAAFRRYLRERLLARVPVGTVHLVAGDAPDIGTEMMRLNGLIAAESVDAAFIGIGENGHIAFNDPPADFATESPFIVVDLDEACRRQQVGEGWFRTIDEVPRQAVSMSVRQILRARAIVCTVPDARKARAVRDAVEGEIGPMVPASILRTHADCRMFLDRAAAALLREGVEG